ncbi:glycosyltransferase family 2 protein [Chryseobacterium taklimakanense]|uniref:glycosyltransferase family 2 protein n=1 Tax=Chryseobacterium taklimakanense TaxID=536441 RepID=UPI001EF5937C|nr:glycosyltransferase family 2 protein [Chryseobacterium taklimakanense]MCG7281479.1 glycosyltransferase family 2 protein [Chryseobacterium taklimakanense]
MENKLAIIIPYYKLKYFRATLDSLAAQTNKNFSVYIGDDCSPENPVILLEEFENKISFQYQKFAENLGGKCLVKQWERCIALSEKEDWLLILGDDDTLSENFVEEFYYHLHKAEQQKIEVIRFASRLIDEEGNPTSKIFTNPEIETAAESYMRVFRGDGRSTLTEHAFTRKTFEKNKFKDFPVAFGSDNVAWLEFPEMGKIYSINNAFANIRISRDHLSSKADDNLKKQRKQGIYQFNRYIIANYAKHFEIEDQFSILKKAYKHLRTSDRDLLKTLSFILFIIKKIGIEKTIRIVKDNKH